MEEPENEGNRRERMTESTTTIFKITLVAILLTIVRSQMAPIAPIPQGEQSEASSGHGLNCQQQSRSNQTDANLETVGMHPDSDENHEHWEKK